MLTMRKLTHFVFYKLIFELEISKRNQLSLLKLIDFVNMLIIIFMHLYTQDLTYALEI